LLVDGADCVLAADWSLDCEVIAPDGVEAVLDGAAAD